MASVIPGFNADTITDIQLLQMHQGMHKLHALKQQQGGFLEDEALNLEVQRIFGGTIPQVNPSFWALFNKVIGLETEEFFTMVTPSLTGDNSLVRSICHEHDSALAAQQLINAYQDDPSNYKYCQLDLQTKMPRLYSETKKAVSNLLVRHTSPASRVRIANLCYRLAQGQKLSAKDKRTAQHYLPIAELDPLTLAAHLLISVNNNDIAVERSAFLRSILLSIDADKQQHIIIIKPTPLFIMKWLNISWLEEYPVTFVLESQAICKLVGRSKHVQRLNVSFLPYAKLNEKRWRSTSLEKATVLALNVPKEIASQQTFAGLLEPFFTKNLLMDGCRVVGLLGRQPTRKTSAPPPDILSHLSLHAITYLPLGIDYATTPRAKVIVQGSFSRHMQARASYPVEVLSFEKIVSDGHTYLTMNQSKHFIAHCGWDRMGYALNQLRQIARAESGVAKKRTAPPIYDAFGPNIRFTYAIYERKHGKSLFVINACRDAPPGKLQRGGRDCGRNIPHTEKKLLRVSDSAFEDVLWEYLQHPVKVRGMHSNTRTIIAEYFASKRARHGYTLREYWLLHPEIDADLDPSLSAHIINFMRSDAADVPLQSIQAENIEEIVDTLLAETNLQIKSEIIGVIIRCLDHAVQSGYISANPFVFIDIEGLKSVRNVFAEILHALRPHSLTFAQRGELQGMLRQHAHEVKNLGMWLQLETGADYREICALCWECLQYDSIMQTHSMLIDRQLSAMGDPVEQARQARNCELSDELVAALLKHKNNTASSLSESDAMSSRRILQEVNSQTSITPRDYKAYVYSVLEPFLPEQRRIQIEDLQGRTQHLHLTWESIDILRRNYEYHSRTYSGLTDGESRYSRGLTQQVVLYRSYVDLSNPLSISNIGIKNKRIIAQSDDEFIPESQVPLRTVFSGQKKIINPHTSYASPSRNIVELKIPANEKMTLRLRNQYGVHVNAVVFDEE